MHYTTQPENQAITTPWKSPVCFSAAAPSHPWRPLASRLCIVNSFLLCVCVCVHKYISKQYIAIAWFRALYKWYYTAFILSSEMSITKQFKLSSTVRYLEIFLLFYLYKEVIPVCVYPIIFLGIISRNEIAGLKCQHF